MGVLDGKRVLVSEPMPQAYEAAKILTELGAEVDFGPEMEKRNQKKTIEQMQEIVQSYDGFIGMSREKFPKEVMEKADRLSVIGKYGIGVDHIDMQTATEKGVLVTISPVNRLSVAEHTVTLILSLLKNLRLSQRYLTKDNWRCQDLLGHELYGKTIGFLGVGGITRGVIARLSGWECSFIGYDPYVDEQAMDALHVRKVSWDELFSQADVISLHLPLTAETRESVGAREFSTSAILINTARGALVQQDDLIRAIKEKQIAGCGLDVMKREEPIPEDDPIMEIAGYDNVILTPHTAGWCEETQQRWCDLTTRNVCLALQGIEPGDIVNRNAIDAWKVKIGTH